MVPAAVSWAVLHGGACIMGLWCLKEVDEAAFGEVVEVLADGAAGVEESAVGVNNDGGGRASMVLVDVIEEANGCGDGLWI